MDKQLDNYTRYLILFIRRKYWFRKETINILFENNRTEFKEELNEKLEKEVVAFLNNREGGVLYIGVNDAGTPVGVSDLDGTQLKIADRLKNNILSSTLGLFDIVTEIVDDIPVIKVLVSSGLEKPYYIKKKWYVS